MYKSRQTTKRQLAVIEDLLVDGANEQDVLKKHGIKLTLYQKWLTDEQFMQLFERRIAQARHTARLVLARSVRAAADKLVALTTCGQSETARKACLDILFPQGLSVAGHASATATQEASEGARPTPNLSPETAARILAILAESEGQGSGNARVV